MGSANSKKPEITIQAIRSSTQDIRMSLRNKQIPLQNKDELHQVLVNNSKQLDTLRAKKPKKKQLEIDQIQKLVRDVNEELLVYNDDHLDKNADESHSFIHVGGDQLKNRKKTPREKKNVKTKAKTKKPPNIFNIEQKLVEVKDIVNAALRNNDLNILKLQKRIIEELSTDLELLNIKQNSPYNTKKINLEKDLRRYYQKILKREKNKDFKQSECDTETTEQSASKLRQIELSLEDVHNILQSNSKTGNLGNLEEINKQLVNIEGELKKIENSEESKTLLMKKVIQSEEFVKEIEKKKELNDLDELMDEIDKLKTEVQIQKESNKGKVIQEIEYKQRKLKELKVKYSENEKFKTDYLEELSSFLEKVQPDYSAVLRRKKLKSSKSVEDLINLQKEWSSLQGNMVVTKVDEAKTMDDLLQKFEESIRAKRKSLENIMKNRESERQRRKSAEIIRTSAKIYELPGIRSTKPNETKEKVTEPSLNGLRFGSIEYVLGEITKISDRVEEIGKEVTNFDGTTENLEFNFFTAALIDKKKILQNLQHRMSWNQVDVLKKQVLEKIEFYEEYLKYKLNQNVAEENITLKLDSIEKKVDRNDLNDLESDLLSCQKNVTYIDNKEKNEWFRNRLSKLREIIKERLMDENLTDTRKILTESGEYLRTLRRDVENAYVLDLHKCAIIEECLMSKTLELINLNVKNDTPTFFEMKKLLEEIEDIKRLVKTKRKNVAELQKEMDDELDNLQTDISFFEGLPNDSTFSELMKKLEDLELKLCNIRETDDTSEKNLKVSLRITYMKDRLVKLSLISEKLFRMEERVREMLEIINNGFTDGDYEKLDEELINTKIVLEKMEVSEKLSYRKIMCLSYIEYLMKRINERVGRGGVQISGGILV